MVSTLACEAGSMGSNPIVYPRPGGTVDKRYFVPFENTLIVCRPPAPGAIDKWLSHRPLTAESWVRIPLASQDEQPSVAYRTYAIGYQLW